MGASTKAKNVLPSPIESSFSPLRNLTPLLAAIQKGNHTAVYALINVGADITVVDENGWTALHWAAHSQNPKIVIILIDCGADPNVADFEGATPLHIAGDGQSVEIVALLIQAGANPNARNEFGVKAADKVIGRGLGHGLTTAPNDFTELVTTV
jgi:cytohesin